MRSRIIVASLLLFGVLAAGTVATSGDNVAPSREWAIASFTEPVLVAGQFLMGQYLIVHDETKMAQGKPCTTIYRFDPAKGPQETVLSFHCVPTRRQAAGKLTLTQRLDATLGVPRVTEYQFAGDSEGHRIPSK